MCQNKVAALVVSASSRSKLYIHQMYLMNSELNMPTKNGDRIMGDVMWVTLESYLANLQSSACWAMAGFPYC